MMRFNLKYIIRVLGLFILGLVILIFTNSNSDSYLIFNSWLIVFGIAIIPFGYTFIGYWIEDRNKVIEINKKQIKYKYKDAYKKYLFTDIEVINKYMSIPASENRMHWLLSDGLFFWEIKFKNGDTIRFSCLILENLNIDKPQKIKKVLIPTYGKATVIS